MDPTPESDRPPTPNAGRVLLVDDSPFIRALIGGALRGAAYDVREAQDGPQALELLAQRSFDVVLSDLQMPGLDGFAVLQAAKFCDPDIEVVLLTGVHADDVQVVVRALRLGATDFLTKSSSPGQVISSVDRAMERRRQREELKRVADRYRELASIVQSTDDAVVSTSPTGTITAWNRGAERVFGYVDNEALGEPITILIPPGRLEEHGSILERVMAGEGVAALETERLTKGGALVPVSVTTSPITNGTGGVVGISTIARDVSERKRAESALRKAERAYQDLVESVKAVVWRADAKTLQFSFVSHEAETLLGYPVDHWTDRPTFWSDHIHPDDREWAVAYCKRATEEMRPHEFEYRMIAADGRVVWLRDIVRVVVEEARPRELIGVMVDIGERKHAEERLRESEGHLRQAQKMEAIGRLAGGVAHDFNNLLTAILGYSDLLLRHFEAGDPQRSKIEQIQKAAERAADLTHQLLAFSRKQVLRPKILDLNELVAGVGNMLRRLIGEDIQLLTVLKDGLGLVKADPGQLEQVLLNLAVNARDAMPTGGRLTIETADADLDETFASGHPGSRTGRHVMLMVADTGTGMGVETQRHIFEPFFTTKEPGKGTGLGLATVYGIVKQSEGYIAVRSGPGQGASFEIYLPRVDELPERPAHPTPEAGSLIGIETILLVEDEEGVRQMVKEALEGSGYTVLEAPSGLAALEAAERYGGRIDLLLTDVVMPKMSGQAVWECLTLTQPEARVLYMSGYASDYLDRVLDAEVPLLRKPFTSSALLAKIREVLDEGGTEGDR